MDEDKVKDPPFFSGTLLSNGGSFLSFSPQLPNKSTYFTGGFGELVKDGSILVSTVILSPPPPPRLLFYENLLGR